MTTTQHPRSALGAMYAGLGLTAAAVIAAYVDHATGNVLADHIRTGYPAYGEARIDAAATTYLVLLSAVGGLGIVSWLWAIRAVRAGRRRARGSATALFAAGAAVALTGLLVKDTSGDTGLAPLLGWIGTLPSVAGLVAVVRLWRRA